MYARVTTLPIKPDKIDEAVEAFQDVVLPHYQQALGFAGATYLVNPETGASILTTYWTTARAAWATDRVVESLAHAFADLRTGPPVRAYYEVRVQV